MKKYISTILLGMALLSVSCVKEDNRIGNLIRFSAATEFQNGVETRTLYSGDDNINIGGNRYERINWISGDDMYILYKHGSSSDNAIYNVSTISSPSGNKKSTAQVTLASGSTALEWADGTPVFYGVYPATVSSGTAPTVNASGVVSNLSIPVTQTVEYNSTQGKYLPDMRKAYMVSYASSGQISGETVTLPFTPVVTALEFKLKLKEDATSQDVKQVQLKSSSSLAGNYSVNITGYANDAVTWTMGSTSSTSNHVTVSFKNGNTVTEPGLSYNNYLNFTVFVLPVANVSGLSLLIKYHDDTVKELSLSGLTLLAGQKYIITNSKVPNLDYDYYITPISDITLAAGHTGGSQTITVESYKQDKTDANNKKPVPWKMQYTTDNGNTWTDLPSGGYGGFTASMLNHNTGGVPGSGQSSTLALPSTSETVLHVECPSTLKNATAKGSTGSPYDLSTEGDTRNRYTANCYIVTAPGVYKFPCVYGNAIKNGDPNYSAYWPSFAQDAVSETGSVNKLGGLDSSNQPLTNTVYTAYAANGTAVDVYWAIGFRNAKDGYIASNNNVITDVGSSSYSAIVLWQDVPQGDEIIPYEGSYVSCDGNYITFRIDRDHIKPGNVVIALRGTAPNLTNEIFWSWHIWIPEAAVGSSSNFMNRNLGQVTQTKVPKYADRSLKFRIVQTDGTNNVDNILSGGASEEFTFSQEGDNGTASTVTRNTYYQWGRKDPMLNTNDVSNVSINPSYVSNRNTFFTSFQGFTFDANAIDYGRGIRAPYWLFENSKTKTWMDGNVYPWYSGIAANGTVNMFEVKTGKEYRGPFTDDQKSNLENTTFTGTWRSEPKVVGYKVNSTGHSIQWTTAHAAILGNDQAYSLLAPFAPLLTNMTYDGSTWWTINENTEIDLNKYAKLQACQPYVDATKYNNLINNGLDPVYSSTEFDWYLDGDYPYGMHSMYVAGTLLNGTGHFDGNSWNVFYDNVNTSYTLYSDGATRRIESSIVFNLWNSYIYSDKPNTTSIYPDNKYKTIYDPCPPGYTVPTKNQLNVSGYEQRGSFPGTSQDGYWTDNPCGIHPKNTTSQGRTYNQSYDNWSVLANFVDYDKAFWKTNGSTAAKATRSTAASIRPMVDPKASSLAPAASSSSASVSPGNSIEGVSFGSDL